MLFLHLSDVDDFLKEFKEFKKGYMGPIYISALYRATQFDQIRGLRFCAQCRLNAYIMLDLVVDCGQILANMDNAEARKRFDEAGDKVKALPTANNIAINCGRFSCRPQGDAT